MACDVGETYGERAHREVDHLSAFHCDGGWWDSEGGVVMALLVMVRWARYLSFRVGEVGWCEREWWWM